MWKRGEIVPKGQFLLFSTIFCCLLVDLCVKTGTWFSLRDKRLFEISEFEITRVDCISLTVANCGRAHRVSTCGFPLLWPFELSVPVQFLFVNILVFSCAVFIDEVEDPAKTMSCIRIMGTFGSSKSSFSPKQLILLTVQKQFLCCSASSFNTKFNCTVIVFNYTVPFCLVFV